MAKHMVLQLLGRSDFNPAALPVDMHWKELLLDRMKGEYAVVVSTRGGTIDRLEVGRELFPFLTLTSITTFRKRAVRV